MAPTPQDDCDSRGNAISSGSIPPCWAHSSGPKTTVQEKLLVPKRLFEAHLGSLAEDGTTLHLCMLCMQTGLSYGGSVISCQRVQLAFKPNQGYVTVVGAETGSILGKRVVNWALEDRSARMAEVKNCMFMVEGLPVFMDVTGQQQPLSTDKILVLEVDMRSSSASPYNSSPGSVPTALVPGIPMFAGSRISDTSCAHCGTVNSGIWRKGWMVPAMVGNPGVQGMADVNLCNGCGLRWCKSPNEFVQSIARTTGLMLTAPMDDEADENARPSSEDNNSRPVQDKQPIEKRSRKPRVGGMQERARPAGGVCEDSDGCGVSADRVASARPAMAEVLMLLEQPNWPSMAAQQHVFMGPDYTGPTACARCGISSCTGGWVRGWVLGAQEGASREPVYANLCNMCGAQYQHNPLRLLDAAPSAWPSSSEQHSHGVTGGQTTSAYSEEGSQGQQRTRKRQAVPQQNKLPPDARKAWTLVGPARKVPRTSGGTTSPPLLPYTSRSRLPQRRPPQIAADMKQLKHSVHDVPQRLSHGTISVQVPLQKQSPDASHAAAADQQMIDEAEVAELLASGMAHPYEASAQAASPVPAAYRPAGSHGSDPDKAGPAGLVNSPRGLAAAMLELPVLSYQPLIVPDSLVLRHFPSAAECSKPCHVRLVYMCAKQYLTSSKEWVQLVRHAGTGQVLVEGASLVPLYGKVLVGWRVADPQRAPGPLPIKRGDSWYWQDPNTSQQLPLASDRVLVLEMRETSAPLQLPLPLPIRPEQAIPATALNWAAASRQQWPGTGGSQAVRSWDGSNNSSQEQLALPVAQVLQLPPSPDGKEEKARVEHQHMQQVACRDNGDTVPPHSATCSSAQPSTAGSDAGAHMDVAASAPEAHASQLVIQNGGNNNQDSAAPQPVTGMLPGLAACKADTSSIPGASQGADGGTPGKLKISPSNHVREAVGVCASVRPCSPPRPTNAFSAAGAARDALMRMLGAEDDPPCAGPNAATADRTPAALQQATTTAGIAINCVQMQPQPARAATSTPQQELQMPRAVTPARSAQAPTSPMHTPAASQPSSSSKAPRSGSAGKPDVVILRAQVQAISAGLTPSLPQVSSPRLTQSPAAVALGGSPHVRLQHPHQAGKEKHQAQDDVRLATSQLNKPHSPLASQPPVAVVLDAPLVPDHQRGGGQSAAAMALALLAATQGASVTSHNKPVGRQEPAPAQEVSVASQSKAVSDQRAAAAHATQPTASAAAAPAEGPASTGAEAQGASQGASIADLQGEVLDVLRPIALGLRRHGGPSVTSVWSAVRNMSAEELRSVKRHGMPWVQTLWDEQQYTDCVEMLKEVLNINSV